MLSRICDRLVIEQDCYIHILHFRLNKANLKRGLIGRANRYLHWCDILYFKDIGLKIYDFGGLALNNKNNKTDNIDKFKKAFGGKIVTEYKYIKGISFLGKVILKFIKC